MRARQGVFVLACAALMLSGCAPSPAASPPAGTDWAQQLADFESRYGTLPDKGAELSDADATAALVAGADRAWGIVAQSYPTAERPTDGFVRWATHADLVSDTGADLRETSPIASCIVDHGGAVDLGQGEDGSTSLGTSSDTEQAAVAAYFCNWVAYPEKPFPPSPQLGGYIWDYYTVFLVPCFEDHAVIQQGAPPTRAQFVSEFPHQTWHPTFPDAPLDDCPVTFPGSDLS